LLNDQIAACTDGRQQRDFLHVEDVADALIALLLSEVEGAVNIASGEAVSIKTIVMQIAHLIGKPELLKLGAIQLAPGDPALLIADVARLRDEVLWSPKYNLHDGLRHTIEWWRKHNE
jgi:nucleoside-diphosphate-sugar epimerase